MDVTSCFRVVRKQFCLRLSEGFATLNREIDFSHTTPCRELLSRDICPK